jgi:AcrR family transcriptional regulator
MQNDKSERYQQILDESLRLFAEHGTDGTSMASIADKVGITKGGLYHHFSGKAEILEAVLDATKFSADRVRAGMSPSDGPLEERLANIGLGYIRMMRQRPYWSLAMLRESLGTPRDPAMMRVKNRFRDLLQGRIDALADCLAEESGDREEATLRAMGFFHGLNSFWLMSAHVANAIPDDDACEKYARSLARRYSLD